MFKIILLLALPLTLLAQELKGTAHGYLVLDNGHVYTSRTNFPSPELVRMFKPNDYFVLPEMIYAKGANFIIDMDNVLYTSHPDGWFFKNRRYMAGKHISKAGGSFFITSDGGAHIVKMDGEIVEHYAEGFELFNEARIMGGVFFITRSGELYIANPFDGKFYQDKGTFKERTKRVKTVGHNYFITSSGTVYTIGFRGGKANISKTKNPSMFKNIKLAGGNYFFDKDNNIHTVSVEGALDMDVKDRALKVAIESIDKDRGQDQPEHFGSNYFVYPDGEIYMVDQMGVFYYLMTLPYYERVGATNSRKD